MKGKFPPRPERVFRTKFELLAFQCDRALFFEEGKALLHGTPQFHCEDIHYPLQPDMRKSDVIWAAPLEGIAHKVCSLLLALHATQVVRNK
jgi:hypothetical protein